MLEIYEKYSWVEYLTKVNSDYHKENHSPEKKKKKRKENRKRKRKINKKNLLVEIVLA